MRKIQIIPLSILVVFLFTVDFQNISAQQQIAVDTHAIFQQSCLICHGPDGAYKESLLMEHNALIEKGSVIPGNPDASELYSRLLTTDTAKRMPLGQPQLPAQSINTIRNWILAGAPDWAVTSTTDGDFISPSEIFSTIETHLMSLEPFDRAFARYFTMTHLYNAGERADLLQEYRKALYKLVNSLSWGSTVINPQPIDPKGTIFYIDLRHYEWDVNDGWGQIEAEYPYHISFDAPKQTALKQQLGRLQGEMKADIPAIHADWFVAQASLPPLYHDLLSLPLTDRELETRLEVDVIRNLTNAPGVRVWRAGTNNSGVSNNNRVIERHTSRYGAYWKSYDFAGSVGTQNIFTHPLNFTHDGGEVIFNLPNGLQAYYVTNASGFRLDEAPINIVSNPAASDPTVRNGLSCFGCHTEGMKTFEDQVRSVIESSATPDAQALRLYVEQSEMDVLVQEDMERYREALEATGGEFGGIEPISRFHEVFQGPVDAAHAAAVVGLETKVFLEKIRENVGLQNIGLLVLDSPNGRMKRDAWTSSFKDILFALDFPQLVDKTPVVPEPDRLPGAFVHIPDTNLRTVVEEALGTQTITRTAMATLTTLKASNRGILDLTGLELAINLEELWISRNPVSDLSPLAGCANLIGLAAWHTPISNLSPLASLTKLEWLECVEGSISDLSPLTGLINLRKIVLYTQAISDISPLAGLTNLRYIQMTHNDITDISPLAKLDNLENLLIYDNEIVDISPLRNLTNLTDLRLCRNKISDISLLAGLIDLQSLDLTETELSDISSLARLINLRDLILVNNKISDVFPLSRLTNLRHLNLTHNLIDNIAPLSPLFKHADVLWSDNPGFPPGGPKIEGPWLWTWVSAVHYWGPDLLAESSDGTVTEAQIAIHGAVEGNPGGNSVWTAHKLSPTGSDNIRELTNALGWAPDRELYNTVLYGSIRLYSPREQKTNMYLGCDDGAKIWLNGEVVFRKTGSVESLTDYHTFFPVTLKRGKNVLLVALDDRNFQQWSAFFGFESGTKYMVAPSGVGYTFSKASIHVGDTFTLDIRAEEVIDLAGWQFDIAFDPSILEAISVSEGNFLKMGGTTLFQSGIIDNAAGKITGLSAIRLSTQGVSGTGALLQARLKAKAAGETELALRNFEFAAITGNTIPAGPHEIHITVEGQLATGDVNRDGRVSILDLVLIARELGKRVSAGSAVDLNRDGVVSILDLILAAGAIGNTIAPAAPTVATESVEAGTIEAWIAQARLEDDGSLAFKQGIENLERLLASLIPEETALLANYPNPFNPETWIPYQLAESAEVTLTIYDMNGQLVRRLAVRYQAAGIYRSRSRAVYWDGRNQFGGSVASGLYFYTLTAGDFTATRRMVILK